MTQAQRSSKDREQQSQYWMRALSFAGLHRILKAVAAFPNGLRAGEINTLVQEHNLVLTRHGSVPAPTTLYHYRRTLLRLCALKRDGRRLRINAADPDVRKLLCHPAPARGDHTLHDSAKDHFAALVLKNAQCRALFFDLFMPLDARADSVAGFRHNGCPVKWTRHHSCRAREVVFHNDTTDRTRRCTSPVSEAALLYGVRYWARDELGLIDEYCPNADDSVVMFPLLRPRPDAPARNGRAVPHMVSLLLSLRNAEEWTSFSILDLITRFCEAGRRPIRALFDAIDWLVRAWPHHIVLIPTSRALATLTATSAQREPLELRRYYQVSNGPYISHLHIHKDIVVETMELTDHHGQHSSKLQAAF